MKNLLFDRHAIAVKKTKQQQQMKKKKKTQSDKSVSIDTTADPVVVRRRVARCRWRPFLTIGEGKTRRKVTSNLYCKQQREAFFLSLSLSFSLFFRFFSYPY